MGRILFIRGGAVGDFILTMPSLRLVRETLPDNEIEILGYPSIASLALSAGLADRVRPLEDPRLATFFAPGAALDPSWCGYFAGFDVVISYLYDPDGHFSGNLRAAGVRTLVACPFRPDETPPHVPAAVQFARPLESLGLFLDDPVLDLPYPDTHEAASALASLPGGGGPLFAIHPGSGSPQKNWGQDRWIDLLGELRRLLPGLKLIVTSGEAETNHIDDFLARLDETGLPWLHLADRPLPEIASIYRRIDGYLGHDSGLSHLAASAAAKGLLLFGPTEPAVWAPLSPKIKVLRSPDGTMAALPLATVVDAARELFTS